MAAQFSWAAGADVGLGIANAISAWGTASANSIVTKANIAAQRVITDAQNKERASALSLAATMRTLAYNSMLKNAGNASNDAAELFARTQDSWTRGNFELGLRSMEQLGAYTARAAASGVGGASVQMVSYSVRLQQDRLAQLNDEKQGQQTYEMIKARSGIMPAAESRLDVTPLKPNFDYSSVSPASQTTPNLSLALIQGLLSKRESLQTALDSIQNGGPDTTQLPTGDFARMDRLTPITID